LEALFIGSLGLSLFAYFGYPATLYWLGRVSNNEVKKAPVFPFVTRIITAHNEEKRIRGKLENTFSLDYPKEKLQVLVASDGSTDATNSIVASYGDNRVELLAVEERQGKESAQKEAVKRARGEVLVFSDVATRLEPDGIKEIVFNFADPSVGCVSSEDRLLDQDGKPSGEGAYVRYEMWLRRLEGRVNSLVGLSGSFFAARREVCEDFSGEMQSDFRTVLNSIKKGFRAVSDPSVIGYYPDVQESRKEFNRKVRTVVRGLTVFFRNIKFLNPIRYGLFSYQLLCHKLLRWLVPLFLAVALCANALLARHSWVYTSLFFLHMAFYATAFWGWRAKAPLSNSLVKIPTYFLIVNAAIFLAWLKYLGGQRLVMWSPSER
jgi:glycosyltransferase involved in cell wall biosynthesis